MIKTIQERPGLVWIPAFLLNFFLWYLSIMTIGNIIKPIVGDCQHTYKIDKYVKTDLFCPTEDSLIDESLRRSEEYRNARRKK